MNKIITACYLHLLAFAVYGEEVWDAVLKFADAVVVVAVAVAVAVAAVVAVGGARAPARARALCIPTPDQPPLRLLYYFT